MKLQSGTRKAQVCWPATATCGHEGHGAHWDWHSGSPTESSGCSEDFHKPSVSTERVFYQNNGAAKLKDHVQKKILKIKCFGRSMSDIGRKDGAS